MNCKTELDIAEREKQFRKVQSLYAQQSNQGRIAQRVKLYCDAMNCKTELYITEREKYFRQVESFFGWSHHRKSNIWSAKEYRVQYWQ